jgi:replicative DNA helicase
MSDAELALLGHLIGDGCTLPRHAIQYTTREPELGALVADLAEEVFGEAVTPRVKAERTWYQVYLAATARLTHGVRNPVAAWLDELGVFGLRSHEKRVPEEVFRQPVEAIQVFLRHLWATDGCLWAGSDRAYPAIRYDTTSEELGSDVVSLLLRLGITARHSVVSMGTKGRPSHRVEISGREQMVRFLSFVGAVGERRSNVQDGILDRLAAMKANTSRDTLPRETWKSFVNPAMVRAGVTASELQERLGMSYCGSTLTKNGISRERAERIADIVESQELRSLAQSDVYWDEVIGVTPDGEQEVFDLTVDELHNFVAANIVVHNSIEQDADLVAFVYRDEYYNGEESDSQGLAEVILAKHRNGPTDSVKLSFLKRYAKFTDLAAAS